MRFLTTVAMILFFAWCLLPVPSMRSLIGVAMATPDIRDHWTSGVGYEKAGGVLIVEEPAATFDERFYFTDAPVNRCKL